MIDKTSGYFESFDGTPIYYEVRGKGKPLVFAYGIVCTMNHWTHQLRFFSEKYQTICLDYRGHPRSGTPRERENLSIDAIARDINILMEKLGHEKAVFLSHSFGGQVLVRAYDMFPDMFSGLIFVNSFAVNPMHGKFSSEMMNTAFNFIKEGYNRMPETVRYVWKALANNPISMKLSGWSGGFNLSLTSFKDIEIYSRGVAAVELDVFVHLFEHMVRYDGLSVAARITVPTLIIGGTQDGITPLRFQKALHATIKKSELLIVPYGSHCTQLDMPELVNLRIQQFLKAEGY